MTMTIRKQTTKEFMQLSASDSLAKAQQQLGGRLGIIVDEEGKPVTMVALSDLQKLEAPGDTLLAQLFSRLPPGIVTAADVKLEDFVGGTEITALNAGARGAMVYDKTGLVGVLTTDAIDRYIAEEFEPVGRTRGLDSILGLAGDIVTKPIILYCITYNHRNELEYFDPDHPLDCVVKEPKPHAIR